MKAKVQTEFEAKAVQIHTISQLLKAYSLYQLRRPLRHRKRQGHHRR